MKNPDFEKLGYFYLGKEYDREQRKVTSNLVLYESKQLTTHAVCVGMTGSGKTGLCLSLLEEAAIDGIPVIAIDPKGDLGNLLLTFPQLRGEDFAPWIDPDEANRKGLSREAFAEQTAKLWQDGLATWGQDGARIRRFHESADLAIYTPGSSAGLPLTVLRSFAAPPAALLSQGEAYRERVASSVSGLLCSWESRQTLSPAVSTSYLPTCSTRAGGLATIWTWRLSFMRSRPHPSTKLASSIWRLSIQLGSDLLWR